MQTVTLAWNGNLTLCSKNNNFRFVALPNFWFDFTPLLKRLSKLRPFVLLRWTVRISEKKQIKLNKPWVQVSNLYCHPCMAMHVVSRGPMFKTPRTNIFRDSRDQMMTSSARVPDLKKCLSGTGQNSRWDLEPAVFSEFVLHNSSM